MRILVVEDATRLSEIIAGRLREEGYAVDATGSGTPGGKLVQIIVRWNEPQVGWHQIVVTTFKRNPANLF